MDVRGRGPPGQRLWDTVSRAPTRSGGPEAGARPAGRAGRAVFTCLRTLGLTQEVGAEEGPDVTQV